MASLRLLVVTLLAPIAVAGCASGGSPYPTPPFETPCLSSADCPQGLICHYSVCVDASDLDMGGDGDPGRDEPQIYTDADGSGDGDSGDPMPICACTGLQQCVAASGTCLEPVICLDKADCLGTRVCARGRCVDAAAPECATTSDCPTGSVCDGTGSCVACVAAALSGPHCPGDQVCVTGVCTEPSVCIGSVDCGSLRTCQPTCDVVVARHCEPPATCGNGIVEVGEQCDGAALGVSGNTNCHDLGYDAGTLSCRADCTFDVSNCSEVTTCGNGVIDGPKEVCDGSHLNSKTCALLGFAGGTLACDSMTCTQFDTSGCTPATETCGNGVKEGHELCDGSDFGLGSTDCHSYNSSFTGGTVACGGHCQTPTCVNDALEPDNTSDTAHALAVPGTYSTMLCGSEDDWYSLPIAVGDGLIVRLAFSRSSGVLSAGLEPKVQARIYDAGVNLLSGSSTAQDGVMIVGVDKAPTPPTLLRVNSLVGQQIPVNIDVVVVANGFCWPDEQEPNDTSDTATVVPTDPSNETYSLRICPSDQDWFAVQVTAGHSVQVSVNTLSGTPVAAELLANGTPVLLDTRPLDHKTLTYDSTGETFLIRVFEVAATSTADAQLVIDTL